MLHLLYSQCSTKQVAGCGDQINNRKSNKFYMFVGCDAYIYIPTPHMDMMPAKQIPIIM